MPASYVNQLGVSVASHCQQRQAARKKNENHVVWLAEGPRPAVRLSHGARNQTRKVEGGRVRKAVVVCWLSRPTAAGSVASQSTAGAVARTGELLSGHRATDRAELLLALRWEMRKRVNADEGQCVKLAFLTVSRPGTEWAVVSPAPLRALTRKTTCRFCFKTGNANLRMHVA
ncbi:hypothetical protein HPB50_005998 [Hyalomma asiaticum]|uniref:Uncharacterized protein n=1 Tax=Hyalomma asiaticum TaxID=266040 RepID=A0ACB7S6Z3_HYAAI|nr:hypothetical protein HPB50_005998 [Hyalomma asiaticum]